MFSTTATPSSPTAPSSAQTVRIRTADNHTILVEPSIISRSNLIASLLEHSVGHEIHLEQVSEPIMRRVIEYCRYHRNDPPWEETAASSSDATATTVEATRASEAAEWDHEFCRVDQGTLFELIKAANFLEVMGLLDLTCRTVADMIRGRTVEEIRETFNIQSDFTPEEEEAVRRDNAWCEDEE